MQVTGRIKFQQSNNPAVSEKTSRLGHVEKHQQAPKLRPKRLNTAAHTACFAAWLLPDWPLLRGRAACSIALNDRLLPRQLHLQTRRRWRRCSSRRMPIVLSEAVNAEVVDGRCALSDQDTGYGKITKKVQVQRGVAILRLLKAAAAQTDTPIMPPGAGGSDPLGSTQLPIPRTRRGRHIHKVPEGDH